MYFRNPLQPFPLGFIKIGEQGSQGRHRERLLQTERDKRTRKMPLDQFPSILGIEPFIVTKISNAPQFFL